MSDTRYLILLGVIVLAGGLSADEDHRTPAGALAGALIGLGIAFWIS